MKFLLSTLVFLLFLNISFAQSPEQKLKDMGIELQEVTEPSANFVKWRKVGNLLFLAGDGSEMKGKLGKDLTVAEGYDAARQTGVDIISTLKAACGDFGKIKQFVKVRGMVNSTPDFYDQPKVINGFSDLMVEVFGEKGKHARAAVGHCSLPSNIVVEIEVVVELEE
ncbi:RidA family protein [Gramella jeungdoensis]|uniref:RidA family protein n=1 Tax=Gramella jeungdoensis TaxID=708091 RepID=A0ABT0Z0L1_9FLAO|nr:RidA family protein [Gramella jeungdoensis]MCM8569109.1 RidA family protein [Gramella jeungdoensis]